jgi:hypothetical protein
MAKPLSYKVVSEPARGWRHYSRSVSSRLYESPLPRTMARFHVASGKETVQSRIRVGAAQRKPHGSAETGHAADGISPRPP